MADHRRASQATTDQHPEADLAGLALDGLHADVMDLNGGTILDGPADRDLELAWQEGEFRVEGRPFPDQLCPDQRVDEFIGSHAGEMIGSRIPDAVAAGLDRMHLDRRELGQNVGHGLELRPVELDVLARREMRIAPVIGPGDVGELADLAAGQHPVRHGHPQHRRMLLDVEPVLQPQRQKVVATQLAGKKPSHLVAKLVDAFVDESLVDGVVAVHRKGLACEVAGDCLEGWPGDAWRVPGRCARGVPGRGPGYRQCSRGGAMVHCDARAVN